MFSGFGTPGELAREVTDVASSIAHATLATFFREWDQRLQKCIDTEGEDVD
jgi:hypothetical protein